MSKVTLINTGKRVFQFGDVTLAPNKAGAVDKEQAEKLLKAYAGELQAVEAEKPAKEEKKAEGKKAADNN